MENKICELTVYTMAAALEFTVYATTDDFQERLAEALENGTVILDTIEGTKLILNAINVVAIEIHAAEKNKNISANTPPVKNNEVPSYEPPQSLFYDRPRRV